MPRLVNSCPKYRKHKSSGQAVVSIGGVDHYLGPHGTKASKVEYDRLIAEWLANGRQSHPAANQQLLIKELIVLYWRFAKRHYRKNGRPTDEQACIKSALRPVKRLYADRPAIQFGPKALKAARQTMIDAMLSRSTINNHVGRIRRMFRWTAAEELLPSSIYNDLATVPGLQAGRCDAREPAPIMPVDNAVVEATLEHLPQMVADMVQFQRFVGCRPEEVCMVRPCDIDTTGDVWEYRPEPHKMMHKGRERVIFIGPKTQAVLRPYLLRDKAAYCFVPVESERKRNAERRERRASPMTPSQAARRAKRRPKRSAGQCYTTDSYRRAITRACIKADTAAHKEQPDVPADQVLVPCWAPNRLRHTAATAIRSQFGLEASQVVLGHSEADTTQIYAERDAERARQIMREVG